MELEDDKNVLAHLLHLEAQASTLVDDAQAEADRRLSEAEKQCRLRYDESYAAEVKRLEAVYAGEISFVKEDYKKQLEAYRKELMERPLDNAAFTALAEELLLRRN